jgi:hypothetical protein
MQISLSAKNPDVPSMCAAVMNVVAEVLVVGFLSVLRVDYDGDYSYSYCKRRSVERANAACCGTRVGVVSDLFQITVSCVSGCCRSAVYHQQSIRCLAIF